LQKGLPGLTLDDMSIVVEVPEHEIEEAMRFTGAESEREALVIALTDFNRRKRLESLISQLGTFEHMISREELLALREDAKHAD
jgi:hypothetical protein